MLNVAGIDDDQRRTHTDESGFCGLTVVDLTPSELQTVAGIIVQMDPYAVDSLAVEKPGVVARGEPEITLHYGDTGDD